MFKKISLILILLLSSFLRLYQLDTLPPSLYSDEVDAGYQALVFNQNQTDYFGNKFPTNFHSFADWRSSLYIYFISFFQNITNNSELAIRLPSVFFSVVSIFLFYLLTNSLTASLLLSISPWSIHYGRTGFEAVSGMIAAFLACLYFWKKYTQKQSLKYLLLSVFSFVFTTYCYSTARLFIIFFALILANIYSQFIKKIKVSHLLYAGFFALILISPLAIDTINGRAGYRFSYISIFSDPQLSKDTDYLRYRDIYTTHRNETGVVTPLSSKIFHNKYNLVFQKFLSNYFSSFSTSFLFITGDQNPRHGFGTQGLLYYVDFFLIILGLINILKFNPGDKLGRLFITILIFAPIPFALTRDSLGPHSTRLILMLPSLIYLSWQGIVYLSRYSKYFLPIIGLIYLISFSNFWHYYRFDYPQESAMAWHSGLKEAVVASLKYEQPIYYSGKYEPFLPFFLYYQPYLPQNPPADNIKHLNTAYFDGSTIENKYFFGNINWSGLSQLSTPSIFIVPKSESAQVPSNLKLLEEIKKKYINSEEFLIYANQN